jgi:hypothetical protein
MTDRKCKGIRNVKEQKVEKGEMSNEQCMSKSMQELEKKMYITCRKMKS